MENQRNTIIAIILLGLVWIGFQLLLPPVPVEEQVSASAPSQVEGPAVRDLPPTAAGAPQEGAAKAPASVSGNIVPRTITVDNGKYVARFSNIGGTLEELLLKDYQETADPASPPVQLVDPRTLATGTVQTFGTGNIDIFGDLPYQVDFAGDELILGTGEEATLVFTGRTTNGVVVEKIYSLRGDDYPMQLTTNIYNDGPQTLHGAIGVEHLEPWSAEREGGHLEFVGPVTYAAGELHTDAVKDLDEETPTYQQVIWTGFENKYFLSALVAPGGEGVAGRITKKSGQVVSSLLFEEITLKSGESVAKELLLYFGPRDLDILKDVNHHLAEAIDFGFFAIIARPLLHALKFFYQYVGNYGVAIILITVIIKLLFWPLTQKSYASMKAMQKLQPEMQKIREKFKNDRERLNKEIMELYKTHRVNPLGGCLPMVIQIPVFFALYKVLLGSIELRHAPFFLWITDLSVKDPYYVTPLLMGATMFLQQKMTPTTMDPAQAKIFMLMPVIFTFLFLNFPAGLVIYWLVNNVLSIGQQASINYRK